VAGILNINFPGLDGEALLLSLAKLAVSSGSACNSATMEPSYVLLAMGVEREAALSALRLSFGRFTTSADIDLALTELAQSVNRLTALRERQ
jgi:cysteine desulfurase